jgi:hydrogenase-4 component F
MLVGSVIPAAITLAGGVIGPSGSFLVLPLLLTSAVCWLAAPGETDLSRMTARWSVASANAALAVTLSGSVRAATLMTVLMAVGSAAAVYLVGAVERTAGHRDIGRLRGLGARLPAVFGWLVVVALALAGAPPFGSFAGRLLAGIGDSSPLSAIGLSALSVLALGGMLSSIHRTFLGVPRRDDGVTDPIRLHGRERLVLVMLGACAMGSALAPLSLWRQPSVAHPAEKTQLSDSPPAR